MSGRKNNRRPRQDCPKCEGRGVVYVKRLGWKRCRKCSMHQRPTGPRR